MWYGNRAKVERFATPQASAGTHGEIGQFRTRFAGRSTWFFSWFLYVESESQNHDGFAGADGRGACGAFGEGLGAGEGEDVAAAAPGEGSDQEFAVALRELA